MQHKTKSTAPGFLMLAALALATGCSDAPADKQPESVSQKASYSIGYEMGRNFKHQEFAVDSELLLRGVEDGFAGTEPILNDTERQTSIRETQLLAAAAISERNRAAGAAFLAENQQREGVVALPSGLQYQIIEEGEGPVPVARDQVVIRYRGTLVDGTEFENTLQATGVAPVAIASLIQGLQEALTLMPVGSTWRLFVPPQLALGERGSGTIGPNATLIFEIQLMGIESQG